MMEPWGWLLSSKARKLTGTKPGIAKNRKAPIGVFDPPFLFNWRKGGAVNGNPKYLGTSRTPPRE